jgi:multidrug efflux pump subunit AcrB
MCSRFLKSSKEAHHGRIYLLFERMFGRLLAGYEWGLKRALKYQFLTLCVFLGTLIVTGALYVVIPKGFFPEQDMGSISGSAQDISSAAMWGHLGAMAKIVGEDPDVAGVGYTAGSSAFNTGNYYINLKLRSKRAASADQIIARLRPKLAPLRAPISIFRCRRTSGSAGDPVGPSTNTPCRTPISTNSMNGRPSWWRSCKVCLSSPTSPAISRQTRPRRP